MPRSSNRDRSSRSNDWGVTDLVRERPIAAAAAAAGATAAGLFLWSRRQQISDQLSDLSDQISDWREGMSSDSSLADEGDSFIANSSSGSSNARRGGRRSQTQISEEALTLKETGKATA